MKFNKKNLWKSFLMQMFTKNSNPPLIYSELIYETLDVVIVVNNVVLFLAMFYQIKSDILEL